MSSRIRWIIFGVALVLIVALTWWRVRSLPLEILLEELGEIRGQIAELRRRIDEP